MSQVRITSLTDVDATEVKEGGLSGCTLVVYRYVLSPGEEQLVEDEPLLHQHATGYIQRNALAVGALPPWYRVVKDNLPRAKT